MLKETVENHLKVRSIDSFLFVSDMLIKLIKFEVKTKINLKNSTINLYPFVSDKL
jgi:hypothetical protein